MNKLEQRAIAMLTTDGWRCAKRGWPDLLMFKGNKLVAIEVKSRTDKVRAEQLIILKKLALVMPVFVVRECADGEFREQRIDPIGS